MKRVRALAPAKINPWLEVLGRRPDGYHELDTVLLALDLCDVVDARASEQPGVRIQVEGPFATPDVPRDGNNLAIAAAEYVLRYARELGGTTRGVDLTLTKNVPSRAGLGGGSSDAAAALLAAQAVLGIELESEHAEHALASFGSDCVFFWSASATGFARCTGRGERVEPWAAPRRGWWFAVITPTVESPTAAVYAALPRTLRSSAPARTLPPDVFERTELAARSHLFNRLEDACLASLPQLRAWRALFDELGASHFRLSGSGSSFFGLFGDRASAQESLEVLSRASVERGLSARGAWVLTAAGTGARLAPDV